MLSAVNSCYRNKVESSCGNRLNGLGFEMSTISFEKQSSPSQLKPVAPRASSYPSQEQICYLSLMILTLVTTPGQYKKCSVIKAKKR